MKGNNMNNRDHKMITSAGLILILILSVKSFAAFIQIDPREKDVSVNEIFNLDIVVSDLKEDENIGGFDFNFIYDQEIVDYLSCEFSDVLGSDAYYNLDESSLGKVNCFGFSFQYEFPQSLENVTLATITFKAKDSGTGIFSFSDVIISDAFGDQLPVTLSEGKVNVPEPATGLFFLSSFIVLCTVSINRKESFLRHNT